MEIFYELITQYTLSVTMGGAREQGEDLGAEQKGSGGGAGGGGGREEA